MSIRITLKRGNKRKVIMCANPKRPAVTGWGVTTPSKKKKKTAKRRVVKKTAARKVVKKTTARRVVKKTAVRKVVKNKKTRRVKKDYDYFYFNEPTDKNLDVVAGMKAQLASVEGKVIMSYDWMTTLEAFEKAIDLLSQYDLDEALSKAANNEKTTAIIVNHMGDFAKHRKEELDSERYKNDNAPYVVGQRKYVDYILNTLARRGFVPTKTNPKRPAVTGWGVTTPSKKKKKTAARKTVKKTAARKAVKKIVTHKPVKSSRAPILVRRPKWSRNFERESDNIQTGDFGYIQTQRWVETYGPAYRLYPSGRKVDDNYIENWIDKQKAEGKPMPVFLATNQMRNPKRRNPSRKKHRGIIYQARYDNKGTEDLMEGRGLKAKKAMRRFLKKDGVGHVKIKRLQIKDSYFKQTKVKRRNPSQVPAGYKSATGARMGRDIRNCQLPHDVLAVAKIVARQGGDHVSFEAVQRAEKELSNCKNLREAETLVRRLARALGYGHKLPR